MRFEKKKMAPGWIMSLWTGSGTIIHGHTKLQGNWILCGSSGLTRAPWSKNGMGKAEPPNWKSKACWQKRYFSGSTFFHSPSSPNLQANSKGQKEYPYNRLPLSPAKLTGEEVQLGFQCRWMGSSGRPTWILSCLVDYHWTSPTFFAQQPLDFKDKFSPFTVKKVFPSSFYILFAAWNYQTWPSPQNEIVKQYKPLASFTDPTVINL